MDVCDLKGRDCIERNSTKTYNCSTTCVGIYADVQSEDLLLEDYIINKEKEKASISNKLADLIRKEVMRMKRREKGERYKKYKMLVDEYRKFKAKNVKHFKLNPSANSNAFGEFEYPIFNVKFIVWSRCGATPLNSPASGDLL